MRVEIVDLYQTLSLPAPPGAAGRLTCYLGATPDKIGSGRRRPAVLILPGGGYAYTSTREAEPVALRYLARGFNAFVLDYSCAPHAFPVALREAAMAMVHIRENAKAYGIGGDMVAAVGFSAGGHLCGCLGMLYDHPAVADIGTAAQIRPDALGLHYPVAVSWGRTHRGSFQNISGGDDVLASRLSLEKRVRPDMPPAFIWHTRSDASVPCRNSLLLAAAMEEAGVDFALHVYRTGQHGLSVADETVYPAGSIPEISADISTWLDTEVAFFTELGLKIKDLEENT